MMPIRTQRTLRSLAFAYVVALSVLTLAVPLEGEWRHPAQLLCAVFLVVLFPWWLVTGEPELPDLFADVTRTTELPPPSKPGRDVLVLTALAIAGINALGFLCYALLALPFAGSTSRGVVALAAVVMGPAALNAMLVYGMLARHSAATGT